MYCGIIKRNAGVLPAPPAPLTTISKRGTDMAARSLPPAQFLRECFHYDHETGDLFWKERPRNHFKSDRAWSIANALSVGRYAGHVSHGNSTDYIRVGINYKGNKWQTRAHRVIWKIVNGDIDNYEKFDIDHIDGNGLNNKISNLRLVTRSQNNQNMKLRKDNSSGQYGVFYRKDINKWVARIHVKRKCVTLGYFNSKKDAVRERRLAEIEYGFTDRHGSGKPCP